MLTPAYIELNRTLHAEMPEYGTSGQNYAPIVAAVANHIKSRDVLDYGAGKCTLQAALGWDLQNYDPCVAGIDARPSAADLVVSTDVLEHVEPEHLDAVLNDIAGLTKRLAILAVDTGPAVKFLADGRNAHLIQQPMEWWRPQLEQRFRLIRLWDTGAGFLFIGQSLKDRNSTPILNHIGPKPTTTTITCKSVYTDDQRCENIRSSMLRGLPQVNVLPVHGRTMVLACYGPTLAETVEELKADVAAGGDLWTVSGAHALLLERGIAPMAHIESDPRPHKALCIGAPDRRVAYFAASACSREVFSLLHGFETFVFHVTSSGPESNLIKAMGGQFTVDGGTNVGMCAIGLGTVLGYRNFVIHGMDGSFKSDDTLLNWPTNEPMPEDIRQRVRFHAAGHPNEDQDLYRVWVGDRPFLSSPQMFQSAQDFMVMLNHPAGCKYTLRGDGFIRALWDHIRSQKKVAA